MVRNWVKFKSWQWLLSRATGIHYLPLLALLGFLLASIAMPSQALPGASTLKQASALPSAPTGTTSTKLSAPLAPVTEDNLWKRYNESGLYAYAHGALSEAADSFRTAYESAKQFNPNDLRLATIYANLAAVYRDMGKYSASELLFKRALAIKQAVLPASDPSLLCTMKNYAVLLRKTGLDEDATMLEERANILVDANKFKYANDQLANLPSFNFPFASESISARQDPWLVPAQVWINEPLDVIVPPPRETMPPIETSFTMIPSMSYPMSPSQFASGYSPLAMHNGGFGGFGGEHHFGGGHGGHGGRR